MTNRSKLLKIKYSIDCCLKQLNMLESNNEGEVYYFDMLSGFLLKWCMENNLLSENFKREYETQLSLIEANEVPASSFWEEYWGEDRFGYRKRYGDDWLYFLDTYDMSSKGKKILQDNRFKSGKLISEFKKIVPYAEYVSGKYENDQTYKKFKKYLDTRF